MQEIIVVIVAVVIWTVFWFMMFNFLQSSWLKKVVSNFTLGFSVMALAIVVGVLVFPLFLSGFWLLLLKSLIITWAFVLAYFVSVNS